MDVYLTLIETSGNQPFIFSTNRLRQNIGASELIFRLGTQAVLEAVCALGGPDCWDESTEGRAQRLLNAPRIEGGAQIEPIVATSGRALVLSRTEDTARALVEHVTKRALREAPGLSVAGANVCFDSKPLHEVIREASKKLPQVRGKLPGPEARFLRLPYVAPCRTTGLSAAVFAQPTPNEQPEEQSAVARTKYRAFQLATERFDQLLGPDFRFEHSIDTLEQRRQGDLPWLGVLHADGNNVGKMFLEFDQRLAHAGLPNNNRAYIDGLRRFSLGLELCTERAFRDAVREVWKDSSKPAPIIPVVLGGDDVTVICDGEVALPLVEAFLTRFEGHAASSQAPAGDIISQIAGGELTACAGVALVKPHFPFFVAYDIAEDLLGNAKAVKKWGANAAGRSVPTSAFDFHLVHAAGPTDLGSIRTKLTYPENNEECRLWGGPYVVSPLKGVPPGHWLQAHHVDRLKNRVQALRTKEDGRWKLPRTFLHELRAALFEGKQAADNRLEFAWPRYADDGLTEVVERTEPKPSLFRQEEDKPGGERVYVSGFLDTLEASEVWEL